MGVSWHHYLGAAAGTRPGVYMFQSRHLAMAKAKRNWISNWVSTREAMASPREGNLGSILLPRRTPCGS